MGSYTSLSVGGFEIYSTKSAVDPITMTVFTEADRRVLLTNGADTKPVTDPTDPELMMEIYESDWQLEIAYRVTVQVARDRLHVMGYTLAALQEAYEQARRRRLAELDSYLEDPDASLSASYEAEQQLLQALTFSHWIWNIRQILASGMSRWSIQLHREQAAQSLSDTQRYLLDEDNPLFGVDLGDVRHLLRAAVEAASLTDAVVQDVSDVIAGGWYSADQRVADESRTELRTAFGADVPTVILTEGRTDSEFLHAAFQLLLPHLAEYYTFLDFDSVAVVGGAGALVATVKAFVAARIANRVIAVFDNDAAAAAAMRPLQRLTLPSTVRVLTLPTLPVAESYPTLGPSGSADIDVNGAAVSIELFFGEEILRQGDGALIPIVWKGYEPTVGRYQGEVADKALLQGAFRRKLRASQESGVLEGDWNPMRHLLSEIINAFAPTSPISVST